MAGSFAASKQLKTDYYDTQKPFRLRLRHPSAFITLVQHPLSCYRLGVAGICQGFGRHLFRLARRDGQSASHPPSAPCPVGLPHACVAGRSATPRACALVCLGCVGRERLSQVLKRSHRRPLNHSINKEGRHINAGYTSYILVDVPTFFCRVKTAACTSGLVASVSSERQPHLSDAFERCARHKVSDAETAAGACRQVYREGFGGIFQHRYAAPHEVAPV